jgi:hypothetical protein
MMAAFVFALLSSAATGKPATALDNLEIKCRSTDGTDSSVSFSHSWSEEFGVQLLCIDADIAYDMTPCAPNAGYSSSRITGSADIIALGYTPDFAYEYIGPSLHASVTEDALDFVAIRPASFDLDVVMGPESMMELWKFHLDKVTGTAVSVSDGEVQHYVCQ